MPVLDKSYVEKLFLAWCLKDKAFLAIQGNRFQEESFSSDSHKQLFHLLKVIGRPLDEGMFNAEARKRARGWGRPLALNIKALFEQINVVGKSKLPDQNYVVKELEKRIGVEETVATIHKYLATISDGDIDGAEKLLRSQVMRIIGSDSDFTIVQGEICQDLPERNTLLVDKHKDGNRATGILTGFKKIDAITGGLWKGEMGLIFGLTGIGKSMILLNFAHTARLAHHSVMYITTEMPKRQVEMRYDSLATGIPYDLFKTGEINREQKKKWVDTIRDTAQGGGKLYVVSVPMGCSIGIIKGIIDTHLEENKLDLLIVDYLDMLQADDKERKWSEQYALGTIACGIKQLTLLYDIATWTASMATSDSEDQEVWTSSNIGYSKKKGQYADIAIGINRTSRDKEEGYISAQIVKHRDGVSDRTIKIKPEQNIMRMSEVQ